MRPRRALQRLGQLSGLRGLLGRAALPCELGATLPAQSKARARSSTTGGDGGAGGPRIVATWDLYSLQATEGQQHSFLQAAAAAQSAVENVAALPAEPRVAGAGAAIDLVEAARVAAEELAVEAEACELCGTCPTEPDFHEATNEERELVLRSTWLCAGAPSLAAMRERLEQRIRFLADLEADGWQLEAPVDAEYACLLNPRPKPLEERRLAEAWAIVERWEVGIDQDSWPSRHE